MHYALVHELTPGDPSSSVPKLFILNAPDQLQSGELVARLEPFGLGAEGENGHQLLPEPEWPASLHYLFEHTASPRKDFRLFQAEGDHKLTIRLPRPLQAQVELAASRENTSINRYVEGLLRAATDQDRSSWRCSFCGKGHGQVRGMIAGGARKGSYICDECVALASSMVAAGNFS